MSIKDSQRPSGYFAFVMGLFVVSAGIFSLVSATFTSGLSSSDLSNTGTTLSSASWNRLVNAVLELDVRTSKINYVEGVIATPSAITVPYNTAVYTQNSISLPPGRWEVSMIAPVYGNNLGYSGSWQAYHVHHDLSSTKPSFTPYQSHSYWSEGSPYANSPVVEIVDIATTTTLYWFCWYNGWAGQYGLASDFATYYYGYPSSVEKPYFYAIRLQ